MKGNEPRAYTRLPQRGHAKEAHNAFLDMLCEASSSRLYGTINLTLRVQDGVVQNVKTTVERVVR